ncbi:hypothetical protein [Deferribacter abyssi]|uniref:hypothetical protein n=1 Tax=Deferribacter abyssi TaxID=213806 RepID=UPI003C23A8DC
MQALLDEAKRKCEKQNYDGVIYYGVSNLRFDFKVTDDMVVFFVTADLYCAR